MRRGRPRPRVPANPPSAPTTKIDGYPGLLMKTWQIFLIGMLGATALFSAYAYEQFLPATASVLVMFAVLLGFLLRPREQVHLVRITTAVRTGDRLGIEHSQIAVKVELARLWLLFVPTFAAVAFLVATAAKGTTWNFSLLDWFGKDRFGGENPFGFYIFRIVLFFVGVVLAAWLSERWVLRDAEACSLRSLALRRRRATYAFVDAQGEYYGGQGIVFRKVVPRELARLIVYRSQNPAQSKIPQTCLFHKFVVIGRGLTDLDAKTSAEHSIELVPERAPS
jgi:hypothetical protein